MDDTCRRPTTVLNRFELTSLLVSRLKQGEAVIGGIGNTNFDLWACGHRAENFYMLGSMGLAVPIALGVALAQPQRQVIALEGDGSILMQLGVLATVAGLAPENLSIVVMDNSMYQITGSQLTATASATNVVSIARGAGIEASRWVDSLADFDGFIGEALTGSGPRLVGARIDGEPARATTERDPALIRHRFMYGLGVVKT